MGIYSVNVIWLYSTDLCLVQSACPTSQQENQYSQEWNTRKPCTGNKNIDLSVLLLFNLHPCTSILQTCMRANGTHLAANGTYGNTQGSLEEAHCTCQYGAFPLLSALHPDSCHQTAQKTKGSFSQLEMGGAVSPFCSVWWEHFKWHFDPRCILFVFPPWWNSAREACNKAHH